MMTVRDELEAIRAKAETVGASKVRSTGGGSLRKAFALGRAMRREIGAARRGNAAAQARDFESLADDDLVYVEAVAKIMGVNRGTIGRWAREGKFPRHAQEQGHRTGAKPSHLWRVGDVREWLRERENAD